MLRGGSSKVKVFKAATPEAVEEMVNDWSNAERSHIVSASMATSAPTGQPGAAPGGEYLILIVYERQASL